MGKREREEENLSWLAVVNVEFRRIRCSPERCRVSRPVSESVSPSLRHFVLYCNCACRSLRLFRITTTAHVSAMIWVSPTWPAFTDRKGTSLQIVPLPHRFPPRCFSLTSTTQVLVFYFSQSCYFTECHGDELWLGRMPANQLRLHWHVWPIVKVATDTTGVWFWKVCRAGFSHILPTANVAMMRLQ